MLIFCQKYQDKKHAQFQFYKKGNKMVHTLIKWSITESGSQKSHSQYLFLQFQRVKHELCLFCLDQITVIM
jgi:hypothetical protein